MMKMKIVLVTLLHLIILNVDAIELNSTKLMSKIVDGSEINSASPIYTVSIKYYDLHKCGASMVSEKDALTVAHCVYNEDTEEANYNGIRVKIGGAQRFIGGIIFPVRHIAIHPDFKPKLNPYFYADLAVVRINGKARFQHEISMVDLPTSDYVENTKAYVYGWGISQTVEFRGNSLLSAHLKKLKVKLITDKECQDKYSNEYKFTIQKSQLCATSLNGQGSFSIGDDGGPLIQKGVAIGIACQSPPNTTKIPGIYINVFDFKPYIERIMSGYYPRKLL